MALTPDVPRWVCYPPPAGKRQIRIPWPGTYRLYDAVLHVETEVLSDQVVSFHRVLTNHPDLSCIFREHSFRDMTADQTLPKEAGYYSCKLEYSFYRLQDNGDDSDPITHKLRVSEVCKLPPDFVPAPTIDWGAQVRDELPVYITDAEMNKLIAERERVLGHTGHYRAIEVLQSATFTNKKTALFGVFEYYAVADLRLAIEFLNGAVVDITDADVDNIIVGGGVTLDTIADLEKMRRVCYLYEPKIDDVLQEFDLCEKEESGQMDALIRLAKARELALMA